MRSLVRPSLSASAGHVEIVPCAGAQARTLGHGEPKRAAAADDRIDADPAAVPLDHFLDDGQADAGAVVAVARVQRLKDLEDPLMMLPRNARAIVGDAKPPE